MNQKVFLVHGWSVTSTTTYQALHLKLAENGFDLHEVNLGRFVTLEDNVEIRDIAKAMHNALRDILGSNWNESFHIITHSTGALVTKQWIAYHYKDKFAQYKPLKNVVFLAAPHFGSRLAHHGKSMIAQLKYKGETGKQALTALELGSAFSWNINREWAKPETWKRKGIRDSLDRLIFLSTRSEKDGQMRMEFQPNTRLIALLRPAYLSMIRPNTSNQSPTARKKAVRRKP